MVFLRRDSLNAKFTISLMIIITIKVSLKSTYWIENVHKTLGD
jgi:hypothetical protein